MRFFRAFLIRFAELFVVNCILSAIVTAAFTAGKLLNTQLIPVLLILSANAVFLAIQWVRLRVLCFEVQDMGLYFRIALSSLLAFAAVHFAFYAVGVASGNMTLYTWLFIMAKLISVATNYVLGPAVTNLLSAVVFELLILGIVFLAPLHRKVPNEDELIPLDRDVNDFKR